MGGDGRASERHETDGVLAATFLSGVCGGIWNETNADEMGWKRKRRGARSLACASSLFHLPRALNRSRPLCPGINRPATSQRNMVEPASLGCMVNTASRSDSA